MKISEAKTDYLKGFLINQINFAKMKFFTIYNIFHLLMDWNLYRIEWNLFNIQCDIFYAESEKNFLKNKTNSYVIDYFMHNVEEKWNSRIKFWTRLRFSM